MEHSWKKRAFSPTEWHPAARWAFVLLAGAVLGVGVSYFWRVLYELDARGVSALAVTAGCAAFGVAVAAAGLAVRHIRDFAAKSAVCLFLCGVVFAFANPPLQTPDESDHYLRAYAISMLRLDFDAARGYPDDVSDLLAAFPGAWVNAHTSVGIGTDPDTGTEKTYDTAGYALKQYGKDGAVQSMADSFAKYLAHDGTAAKVKEPISFLILPFLPGALGMAAARLLGFGALGCLYGGRLFNLLAYTLLCYAALRTAKRSRPAFVCVMFLPVSLFMGASLSYDATLLGCYYLMLALLTVPEWNGRTALYYTLACVFANGTKPYINLLWVLLPLAVRGCEWKAKAKRGAWCGAMLAGSLGLTVFVEQYGTLLRRNYGVVARQGGEAVNGAAQLAFVLRNPLRYLAVLWGTLYENQGFVGQLGLFGWKDMPITVVNLLALAALTAAVLLCTGQEQALGRRRTAWLGIFAAVYMVGAMTAMYITYTPVGMVRIVGLQTRYFLACWLVLAVLLSTLLRRGVRWQNGIAAAECTALRLCAGLAVVSAVLLFRHYFVGPVYVIYS